MTRLTMLFQPRSGTSLRLMIGMPSRSSSAALIVAYCTRSGTTLMSTHSLLHALDELAAAWRAPRGAARRRAGRRGARRATSMAWSSVPSTGSAGAPSAAARVVQEADDAVAQLAVGERASPPPSGPARPRPPPARAARCSRPPTCARGSARSAQRPQVQRRARRARRTARTRPGCTPRAAPPRAGSGSRRARRAWRPA